MKRVGDDLRLATMALDWLVSSVTAEDVALFTGRTADALRELSDRIDAARIGGPRPTGGGLAERLTAAVDAVRASAAELGLDVAGSMIGVVSAVIRLRRTVSEGVDGWADVTVGASGPELVLTAGLAVHDRDLEESLRPLVAPPSGLAPQPTGRALLFELAPPENRGWRMSAPGDDAGLHAFLDDLTRYGLAWCAGLGTDDAVLAHLRGLRYPDLHAQRRLALAEARAGDVDRAADALRRHVVRAEQLPARPRARITAFLARFDDHTGTTLAPAGPREPRTADDTELSAPGHSRGLALTADDAGAIADTLGIALLEDDLEFDAWIGGSKTHARDLAARLLSGDR